MESLWSAPQRCALVGVRSTYLSFEHRHPIDLAAHDFCEETGAAAPAFCGLVFL